MTKTLTIIGANICGIPSFYAEINRVFMANEDWTLGHSLDGLNDMLSGNYGAIESREPVKLIWQDMDRSRTALGREETCRYLRDKVQRPDLYNVHLIGRQLAALEHGEGRTYFEIVLDILSHHPNIEFVSSSHDDPGALRTNSS